MKDVNGLGEGLREQLFKGEEVAAFCESSIEFKAFSDGAKIVFIVIVIVIRAEAAEIVHAISKG